MGDFTALTSAAVDFGDVLSFENQSIVHQVKHNNNSQERACALHVPPDDYQS